MSSGDSRIPWAAAVLLMLSLVGVTCSAEPGSEGSGPKLWGIKSTKQLLEAVGKIPSQGATLRLSPGQYVISKGIAFKGTNHINIIGSGWNTTIRMAGKGDALTFEDCGFCTVRDLMIVGGPDAGSGIVFKGKHSSSNTVDFCRIAEFPVSGIRFEGSPESALSSNTVSRCHFIGNLQDQLYSLNNNDFYILQNQFGTHGKHPRTGVVLDHSSAGTYSMNYHWGNEVAFRMGPFSNFNRIENNRFENSDREGVILGVQDGQLCYLNIFTGNTVHTNSESESGKYAAVTAFNILDTTFTSNQIFSWDSATTRHSSSLVIGPGCRNWIVKDNIFRHNTGKPIVFEENAGHIVKDNMMD